MNDEQHREMERYLQEFQPRAVRALEIERPGVQPYWRRLAAAAVVFLALGTSIWYAQTKRTEVTGTARPLQVPVNRIPQKEWTRWELTRLALSDQEKFDELLAEQSRKSLPNLRGEQSTLRVLAQE